MEHHGFPDRSPEQDLRIVACRLELRSEEFGVQGGLDARAVCRFRVEMHHMLFVRFVVLLLFGNRIGALNIEGVKIFQDLALLMIHLILKILRVKLATERAKDYSSGSAGTPQKAGLMARSALRLTRTPNSPKSGSIRSPFAAAPAGSGSPPAPSGSSRTPPG